MSNAVVRAGPFLGVFNMKEDYIICSQLYGDSDCTTIVLIHADIIVPCRQIYSLGAVYYEIIQ